MTSSFLNLDDDLDDISPVIGAGIKSKAKKIVRNLIWLRLLKLGKKTVSRVRQSQALQLRTQDQDLEGLR